MTLNFILLGIVLYLSLLESHYIFAQERGYMDIDTDTNTYTDTSMIRQHEQFFKKKIYNIIWHIKH